MPDRKKTSHAQKRRGIAKQGVCPDDLRHQIETTRAVELRARGWTYKEIAGDLKCGTTHISHLLTMGLKQINEKHDHTVAEFREREWAATQLLLERYLPLALDGDTDAFDRVLRLLERRAKYRGLDVIHKEDKNAIAGALNLNVDTFNVQFVPREQLKEMLLSRLAEHQREKDRAAAVEFKSEVNDPERQECTHEPENEGTD